MLRREKPRIIRIRRMRRGRCRRRRTRSRREIHLDHVGDIDGRDIGPVVLDARYPAKHEDIKQRASSGLSAYLLKNFASSLGLVRL